VPFCKSSSNHWFSCSSGVNLASRTRYCSWLTTAMIIEGLGNTKCRRGILVETVRDKRIA
jgi:hypothetical protein